LDRDRVVPVASFPDPTSPGIIAVTSPFFGFLGTTRALWRELPQDDVRWTAFLWGYLGVGLGLLIYCFSVAGELY
jgi:hypothetical protein